MGAGEEETIHAHIEEVARALLGWSKDGSGNFARKIKKLEEQLHEAQKEVVSQASCEKCTAMEKELDDLNAKQEAY